MIALGVAVVILVLSIELWLPLAFLFGGIKLLATFSIIAAWEAFRSVPTWIWDFILGTLS